MVVEGVELPSQTADALHDLENGPRAAVRPIRDLLEGHRPHVRESIGEAHDATPAAIPGVGPQLDVATRSRALQALPSGDIRVPDALHRHPSARVVRAIALQPGETHGAMRYSNHAFLHTLVADRLAETGVRRVRDAPLRGAASALLARQAAGAI